MAAADLLAEFSPQSNEPPSTSAATPDMRNGHPVLDFDASADEAALFTGFVPWHYAGGGITVYAIVAFSTDVNNTHTGQLEIAFERIGDAQQDLDADGFAAARDLTVTVPATGGLTEIGSVLFSDGVEIDNVAAGELFRVKVNCDTSDSTFTGDLELLRLVLRETP
ncbi:MAG: hypothetical protein ABIK89_06930 [Planctomycetota bacterium]